MAVFKFSQYLDQSNHEAFDLLHDPGKSAPHSGIYRCEGCGLEIVSVHTRPLPGQDHHPHGAGQGLIRWRLIVTERGA